MRVVSVRPQMSAQGRGKPTGYVEVMCSRDLKSGSLDSLPLSAVEAVALAHKLLLYALPFLDREMSA